MSGGTEVISELNSEQECPVGNREINSRKSNSSRARPITKTSSAVNSQAGQVKPQRTVGAHAAL
jgi:hypothetical protein